MIEFRIIWRLCGKDRNNVMFVEAADAATAQGVAIDYIERKKGIACCDIVFVSVSRSKPVPSGSVREEK